jgi:acyl-CoA-dependent ceramide synthase
MEFTTICDVTFGLFALSWPITRHGFFTVIVWSTLTEPNKYMDMKWEPEKGFFMTPTVQKLYTGLFMILNIIMIYWFALIIKVITRVLQGNNAEDTRSDNEEDDHDEK